MMNWINKTHSLLTYLQTQKRFHYVYVTTLTLRYTWATNSLQWRKMEWYIHRVVVNSR